MRTRTVAALVALLAAFAGAAAVALWTPSGGGGTLTEVWVSDTGRPTQFNHHGVGAADGVVVAPVLSRQGTEGLTRHSCALVRLAPANGSVLWRSGVPPERCFIHALTKPAIADLNGDGSPAVVAGTTENATVALAASDGRELFRLPTPTYGYGEPTVADVRGDGRPEIVASDIGGHVVVASGNGTVIWRGTVDGVVYAKPVVADVDGDGRAEVVVAGREQTVAFAPDGTALWRREVGATDAGVATVDGAPRVVVAGNDGVVALDGATGERLWNRSADGTPSMGALADGDGDGTPEAYVSVPGNLLRAFDASDGHEEWQTRLASESGTITPPAVLGDLDGDGAPELVAGTNGGTVAVLDPATGAELAAYERDDPIWTGSTTANLTDDPGEEILVRYGRGRVVALEYDS
ncbi:MAG: PQQ-binding-like beta-propeller repeat protein [Halosimplex sp.]